MQSLTGRQSKDRTSSLERENVVTLKLRKFNFEQGFIILHNLVSNSRLMIQTEFIRDICSPYTMSIILSLRKMITEEKFGT